MEDKQKILETLDIRQRLREITLIVNHQLEILELGSKIQSQVQEDIDKSQRDFYLRQQLKAIREELGESDENRVEVAEYRKKIEEKMLTEEARKEAFRELDRMSRMHPASAEYSVATTYLDWITSLPWNERTQDNQDIRQARRILDEDHYGLDKAKKRIIEYLAVRKLKPDTKGPILCFVGPPGTGKTSLAQSIARRWDGNFIGFLWAGFTMKRKSAVTAGLTSARCRGASFREFAGLNPATPFSYSMKSTRWAATSGEIPPPLFWKCLIRSRISPSWITTWVLRLTFPM